MLFHRDSDGCDNANGCQPTGHQPVTRYVPELLHKHHADGCDRKPQCNGKRDRYRGPGYVFKDKAADGIFGLVHQAREQGNLLSK
jgi:hypothetical protein